MAGGLWRGMNKKTKIMASNKNLPPKRRRIGLSSDYDDDSDSDMEVRQVSGFWPSWLIIEAADEEKPLSGLSPFAIAKGIKGLSGEPKSVKKLRNGSLLVQCASKKHSELMLKSKILVDRPIKVSAHKSMNSTKGVIRCPDLRGVTEAEIKSELASQGVTDVHRVMVKKGSEKVPTNTFFLTFCTTVLPPSIKVGYLQVRVSLYVPSPLRCFKCQQFGHTRDRCQKEEVCGVCSKAAHQGACDSPAHCVNCEGSHPSYAKNCPVWQKESTIQKVKTERRIPFFEARKIVEKDQPKIGISYAAAVRKPTTVEIGCQTDSTFNFTSQGTLTLGKGSSTPSPSPSIRGSGSGGLPASTPKVVPDGGKKQLPPPKKLAPGGGVKAAPSQSSQPPRPPAAGRPEKPQLPPRPDPRKVETVEMKEAKKSSSPSKSRPPAGRSASGSKGKTDVKLSNPFTVLPVEDEGMSMD